MSATPEISVIMGVHNGRKYLCQAMESVLGQTFSQFEFIVIDDGSTDNTSTLLRGYSEKDSRIKLIENDSNIGLTRSLNSGIKSARSEIIARQDADDISCPSRFARQLALMRSEDEIQIVSSWCDLIDERGGKFGQVRPSTDREKHFRQFANADSPFPHGSVMFRKEVASEVGFYDERFWFAQDFDLWVRILSCPERKVGVVGDALYELRKTPPDNPLKSICQRRYSQLAWMQYERGCRIEFGDVREWAIKQYSHALDFERGVGEHWLFTSLTALQHNYVDAARSYARRAYECKYLSVRIRAIWRLLLTLLPRGAATVIQRAVWRFSGQRT